MNGRTAVGKINRVFGQEGDVVVGLYEAFGHAADAVVGKRAQDSQEPLHVVFDGLEVPLFIDRFERRGRGSALVRFADVDTPERAEMLLGLELTAVCADGDALDFGGLVGWQAVMTVEGEDEVVGTVMAFYAESMNPLLAVDIDGREALLPVAFVDDINEAAQRITLTLPVGLLELNS